MILFFVKYDAQTSPPAFLTGFWAFNEEIREVGGGGRQDSDEIRSKQLRPVARQTLLGWGGVLSKTAKRSSPPPRRSHQGG